MKTRTRFSIRLAGSVALAAGFFIPGQSTALEVYKWTDEQGVTHYSGSPPPEETADFATLSFPDEYATPADSRQNYRDMLAVAKDLEKARLARARIRAEQEANELERSRQSMAFPAGYPAYYPLGFFHGPFFPPFGFRPDFPDHGFPRPILNRGSFVPPVQFRPFQDFDPAATARAIGGEAFRAPR